MYNEDGMTRIHLEKIKYQHEGCATCKHGWRVDHIASPSSYTPSGVVPSIQGHTHINVPTSGMVSNGISGSPRVGSTTHPQNVIAVSGTVQTHVRVSQSHSHYGSYVTRFFYYCSYLNKELESRDDTPTSGPIGSGGFWRNPKDETITIHRDHNCDYHDLWVPEHFKSVIKVTTVSKAKRYKLF